VKKNYIPKEKINEVLHRDSLLEAEKATGKSYKTDRFTSDLGLLIHLKNSEEKKKILQAADDTLFSDSLDQYQRIVEELGFKQIFYKTFFSTHLSQKSVEEKFFIYWRPDGILVHFDTVTWNGKSEINGAYFYYNWIPNTRGERCSSLQSGQWKGGKDYDDPTGWIWAGANDGREGLRHQLSELEEHGKFVTPWIERPIMFHPLHYEALKKRPYKVWDEMTEETIARLPEEVRKMIGPKTENF